MSPRDVWQVYKLPIILGGASLLCIVTSISLIIKSYQSVSPITFSSEATVSGVMQEKQITVDIEGALVSPGVYTMPDDSRIEDVIHKAGGLSSDADLEKIALTINRAAKVVDGAKIFIPKIGEISDLGNLSNLGNLINVNTASQSQLEDLPGVGPVTATKIISGRPYQTLEELLTRKILSKSVFDKVKAQMGL